MEQKVKWLLFSPLGKKERCPAKRDGVVEIKSTPPSSRRFSFRTPPPENKGRKKACIVPNGRRLPESYLLVRGQIPGVCIVLKLWRDVVFHKGEILRRIDLRRRIIAHVNG